MFGEEGSIPNPGSGDNAKKAGYLACNGRCSRACVCQPCARAIILRALLQFLFSTTSHIYQSSRIALRIALRQVHFNHEPPYEPSSLRDRQGLVRLRSRHDSSNGLLRLRQSPSNKETEIQRENRRFYRRTGTTECR